MFHADTLGLVTRQAFNDAKFKLAGCCIWVKNSLVLGHSDWQYSHEPVLYGWRKNGKHKFYGDRKCTTVWNFDKPKKNAEHPNQKPIELISHPIKNSSQINSIILDSFLGSGSTIIACEQINRICYGLELDEKYASVILRRYYQNFPESEITCERGGQIFKYKDLVKEVESP